MKWYAVTTHIDKDTGEVITKKIYEVFYKTTKTEKKIIIEKDYGKIEYTKIGESTRQQRLEL